MQKYFYDILLDIETIKVLDTLAQWFQNFSGARTI